MFWKRSKTSSYDVSPIIASYPNQQGRKAAPQTAETGRYFINDKPSFGGGIVQQWEHH